MREPQRLRIEQDIATARRALHRALATAESGAYYNIEDALHVIQVELAELMDTVMRGSEKPLAFVSTRV